MPEYKLSDEDLIRLTDYYIAESVQYLDEEISEARTEAQKYYNAEAMGTEKPGRSKVVSTDVRDAVEWTLPVLLKIYFSSDHLIEWTGVGRNDAAVSARLTRLFDYILLRDNSGFMVFYSWFKDALLKRIGFVTAYWQDEESYEQQDWTGLTEPEYRLLIADPNYYEEETETYEEEVVIQNPFGGENLIQKVSLYDSKGTYTHKKSSLRIEAVPPEEMFFLSDTKSNKDSRFWLHRTEKTISELRAQGFDIPDDVSGTQLEIEGLTRGEIDERHRYGYGKHFTRQQDDELSDIDPSLKSIYFYNMDVKLDMYGDGVATWWKITRVDDRIISKEPIMYPAYPSLTPVPTPHLLVGDGYYELVGEFQRLKTSLHRILLDYFYFATNPRAEIATEGWHEEFTLADWSNNTPNGGVRVRRSGTINPLHPAPLNSQFFNLLGYVEEQRENSVGVTQGDLGQQAKSAQASATGLSSLMTAAAERIQLIARIFGETGITQLAVLVKDLLVKYPEQLRQMTARLSDEGEVTGLRPEQLEGAYDFIVTVGTGNADKTQILESILAMVGLYEKFIQLGAGPMAERQLVTWDMLYQSLREFAKNAGLRNVSLFTHDPRTPPDIKPPPPPPNPQMIAAQAQANYFKEEIKIKQHEAETKRLNVNKDHIAKLRELSLRQKIELHKLRLMHDKQKVEALSKGMNDGKAA